MAALALIGVAIVIVLAVALVSSRRRHADDLRSVSRARDDALEARDDATLAGERMRLAVDALPLGVLTYDGKGAVVYRNTAAARYTSGRRTEAMVTATIEELRQGAL